MIDAALLAFVAAQLARHWSAERRFRRWRRALDLDTRRRMDEMKRVLTPALKFYFGGEP